MLKLGTTNINLPFAKAFLGSNLVYKKGGAEIEFTVCPFPTVWTTEIKAGLEYTTTDDYGTWRIWADTRSSTVVYIYNLFDNDTETRYVTAEMSSSSTITYVGIDLPSGIAIKPNQLFLCHAYIGTSDVEGLNDNGEWEVITTLASATSKKSYTVNLTTDKFYSKFRLKLKRNSSTYKNPNLYEFQITSGTIREGK